MTVLIFKYSIALISSQFFKQKKVEHVQHRLFHILNNLSEGVFLIEESQESKTDENMSRR
jgi:hypothetical protein